MEIVKINTNQTTFCETFRVLPIAHHYDEPIKIVNGVAYNDYYDLRSSFLNRGAMNLILEATRPQIPSYNFYLGPEISGIALATALNMADPESEGALIWRKKPKESGLRRQLEGAYLNLADKRILICDDLIDSGSQVATISQHLTTTEQAHTDVLVFVSNLEDLQKLGNIAPLERAFYFFERGDIASWFKS